MTRFFQLILCTVALWSYSAGAADAPKSDAPKPDPLKDIKDPKGEAKPEPAKEKDPKDMTADECEEQGLCPHSRKPSKQVYHAELNGKQYHFCSRDCQKMAASDPAKYLGKNVWR